MSENIDHKFFKVKVKQKDQQANAGDVAHRSRNDEQKNAQTQLNTRNSVIKLSSVFEQSRKQQPPIIDEEAALGIGFDIDPEDKLEFEFPKNKISKQFSQNT